MFIERGRRNVVGLPKNELTECVALLELAGNLLDGRDIEKFCRPDRDKRSSEFSVRVSASRSHERRFRVTRWRSTRNVGIEMSPILSRRLKRARCFRR